jgi:hypothetical protein
MAVCLLVAEKLGPTANIGRYSHDHMDKHVHRSKGEVLVPKCGWSLCGVSTGDMHI